MNLIELMDLYELEPVMARLRLHELVYSFDGENIRTITFWMGERHKGQYANVLKRWQLFSKSLNPTWVGLLSLHSRAMVMDVDFDGFTEDDWIEMQRINPNIEWYRTRQRLMHHACWRQ